jgi:hypothetical protein
LAVIPFDMALRRPSGFLLAGRFLFRFLAGLASSSTAGTTTTSTQRGSSVADVEVGHIQVVGPVDLFVGKAGREGEWGIVLVLF